jgi:hypothetical protein
MGQWMNFVLSKKCVMVTLIGAALDKNIGEEVKGEPAVCLTCGPLIRAKVQRLE